MSTKKTDQDLINEGLMDGEKSFDFLWNQLSKQFNWNNVYLTMQATKWEWYFGKTGTGKDILRIPSLAKIKQEAMVLLEKAYNDHKIHSSGGFTAEYSDGMLSLSFVVEEATSDVD